MAEGKCIPFIYIEYLHAEQNNDPGDDHDDNHTYRNGHVVSRNGGEDLSTDNTVHHTVSQHDDDIQQRAYLAGIVTHEIPSHDLICISPSVY